MSWTDRRLFWREFRAAFRTTGAVLPSGRALAGELCRHIAVPADGAARGRRLLEVGPGTGAVTDVLVSRLGPRDQLDLVEINPAFVARLQQRQATERNWQARSAQMRLVHGSVETFATEGGYDAIVSSLPLNNFTAEEVATILIRFARWLKPAGRLAYFEYLGIRGWKLRQARGDEQTRLQRLDDLFGRLLAEVDDNPRRVWCNVPPAYVHHVRFPENWSPESRFAFWLPAS